MSRPWEKFSLPAGALAFASGSSAEFRKTLRKVFGPLVEFVDSWPSGRHAWLMVEVPPQGSLGGFFRSLERRLEPGGSLWVVFPKKPFLGDFGFAFDWSDVQKAGLSVGLVDNKVAAFSSRLTSIRFVIPLARRQNRTPRSR